MAYPRMVILFSAVVLIVAGVTQATRSAAGLDGIHGHATRRVDPVSNPEASKFLRRVGGAVTVLGNQVYYDGGSVSAKGISGTPNRPANTTLIINLAESWDSAGVKVFELTRPDTPPMEFPTFLTDESSNCSYAWGGRNAYNFSLPHPFKYWRLCIKKKEDAYGKREQAEWEEVDSTSADQLAQLTPTSHSAFVSTPEVGFIFGGKEHKEDGSSSNAPFYRWFNFTSKESREYENPPYTSDSTLWGATAVYVPDFGPNGLVFILGGVGLRDQTGAAYVGFENLHFMDPITRTWYKQTATSSGKGFPYRRHQHCAAGLPGANGTYDIYIFGGANDDMRTAFSDVHVLSLPSFTWNFVAEFPDAYRRQGHACAIAGNSQLLSWGGLPYHTSDDATSWELEDPLPQGVGVFDLNRLSSLSTADLIRYDASAKSYRAEESLVAARPTSVEWSSPEVAALFARTGMDDTSADPRSQDESNTEKSTTSVGIIVGAVIGGLVLIAVAAAAWWFFIVRKRRSTKTASKETPSSLDDKRSPETKPAELQDPGKPAEMTGGSEAVEAAEAKTQPVHEMEGDPANRP